MHGVPPVSDTKFSEGEAANSKLMYVSDDLAAMDGMLSAKRGKAPGGGRGSTAKAEDCGPRISINLFYATEDDYVTERRGRGPVSVFHGVDRTEGSPKPCYRCGFDHVRGEPCLGPELGEAWNQ